MDVLRRFPEVRSIHWAINDTPAEQTNLPTKLLWGADAIEEEILGLRFRVRPSAFLQTNTEMAARLYELAREYAGLEGDENVFDLYCGTGTIGLSLAGSARAVWGLEISEEAVACAIENAELNEIENARFFAGNVGQTIEELREEAGSPDVVVVDPPRRGRQQGSGEQASARRASSRLVQPDDAFSDLPLRGGTLRARALPADMFPHARIGLGSSWLVEPARPEESREEVGVRAEPEG